MNLCKTELCTGCAACANSCPKNCIHMEPDVEGFLRPNIQADICIECGLCESHCSVLHPIGNWSSDQAGTNAYCVHYKDDAIRSTSTSGGAFTALCEWVFQRNGVVFGAAYDTLFQVVHVRADDMATLGKLRTAKYAQSQIGNSFQEVKKLLNEGRYVLFSGTPCQIAGLSSYLGGAHERLVLVDLICHGTPSPAVWQAYIRYRSQTDAQGAEPISVNLRSKKTGWPNYSVSFTYETGINYSVPNSADPFMRAFVGNLCLRPACYDCQFKGLSRASDFTLGDYWGVWNQEPEFNDGCGTSLVLVHNEKATAIWNEVCQVLRYKQVDVVSALVDNPSALRSSEKPSNREIFMDNHDHQNFEKLVDSLRPIPVPCKKPARNRILRKILCKLHEDVKK